MGQGVLVGLEDPSFLEDQLVLVAPEFLFHLQIHIPPVNFNKKTSLVRQKCIYLGDLF